MHDPFDDMNRTMRSGMKVVAFAIVANVIIWGAIVATAVWAIRHFFF